MHQVKRAHGKQTLARILRPSLLFISIRLIQNVLYLRLAWLLLEPFSKSWYRGKGGIGPHPRKVLLQILHDLLNQRVPKGTPLSPCWQFVME